MKILGICREIRKSLWNPEIFCEIQKYFVKSRNLLWNPEIFCEILKSFVKSRNILWNPEIFVKSGNLLWNPEIFCEIQIPFVKSRNLLWNPEIFREIRKPFVKSRNLLRNLEIFCEIQKSHRNPAQIREIFTGFQKSWNPVCNFCPCWTPRTLRTSTNRTITHPGPLVVMVAIVNPVSDCELSESWCGGEATAATPGDFSSFTGEVPRGSSCSLLSCGLSSVTGVSGLSSSGSLQIIKAL